MFKFPGAVGGGSGNGVWVGFGIRVCTFTGDRTTGGVRVASTCDLKMYGGLRWSIPVEWDENIENKNSVKERMNTFIRVLISLSRIECGPGNHMPEVRNGQVK
jgi:hypothetical protein